MHKKPTKGDFLGVLLRSPNTIFSTKDVALLWEEGRAAVITNRLKQYVRAGKLVRVRRGVYAKDQKYDRWEMATRMYTPSYISFETVLTRAGVTFQRYNRIFVATYVTRDITVAGQDISFIRLRGDVLRTTAGIDHAVGYSIAVPERAFLDRLAVSPGYHFDHVGVLNWEKVFTLLPLYRNARLEKEVRKYFQHFQRPNP